MFGSKKDEKSFKYTGKREAMDGNTAVIMCEREASDAAGAYPITPSTQMGEYWAEEAAKGHTNTSGKPLIFIEPESEHAAAAVTAGLSMTGLRSVNFTSAQGAAFMHESLYAAVGKRLPYVLNLGCRAITKASLNVHCAHDDYHCIDDTGFFQIFAKDNQGAADLNIISRKIAELSLTPAALGQDGFLTTHVIEPMQVPERELIEEFLGKPDDMIECPTPAQKMLHGETRRRVPVIWDVDNPMMTGTVQNQDAYMQAVASQRPFFFDHIKEITDEVMEEFYELTGRRYNRVSSYKLEEADYLILGQGSLVTQSEAVCDYLEKTRGLKVGVLDLTMFRPFPGDLIGKLIKGKKGVAVLERTDQPLAEDLPIMREVRSAINKCIENDVDAGEAKPYPEYETYVNKADRPRLYSGSYGLGSRDLQPEGIIAAVENMLPDGKNLRFFYLGIEFYREAANPKQEVYLQELKSNYPNIENMALKGSENPNLLPEGAITVRMHSVGGWGAITTGKNLAITLYDLLGFDIKANPKYGSEKKGQPTTYYLSAAPEKIRLNCEYEFVDVVLSPDPNVFSHSNPVSGLIKGGSFIIQSSQTTEEAAWAEIPRQAQQFIVDNDIRIFFIDGFKIAKEEASNPDLEFRMQGNAFQGAFFAASPLMERANLTEQSLFDAIEAQLVDKFGAKGQNVVNDNLRVVRRGFDEIIEITNKVVGVTPESLKKQSKTPMMLKYLPEGNGMQSDVHRFWEHTGSFYLQGKGNDNLAEPFMATSIVPAATGIYRDMTNIRFEYPKFVTENCTACGECYSVCPDSAIPGLVNTISEVFNSTIQRIELGGTPTRFLRRESRTVEKRLRALIDEKGEQANVSQLIDQAVLECLNESELEGKEKETLEREFALLLQTIGDFQFSITKPYYTNREKKNKGSGGLFSITINPYTCKGCMLCIDVCEDEALLAVPQTKDDVERLRTDWKFWMDLPTTQDDFIRIDDIDEKVGALETLLLDKANYQSVVAGDGACLGCGEKTSIHLFTGAVTALMKPRVIKHLAKLDDLIEKMETHIRMKLAENVDLSNLSNINDAIDKNQDSDLTLASLSSTLEEGQISEPVDQNWLKRNTAILEELRQLKFKYTDGQTNQGRADMGIVNATGCTSVWGATFPYNPYPFPWTSHLFQDAPSVAMGLFEGHMAKMAEGFKAVRRAELELADKYDAAEHDKFFTYFNWKGFSDEEWLLCPPVVAVGGDGAMFDIGFQNLSRAMASGMPVKILVVDTQVYSNTGGQACTSGFVSQVSDMAPYGKEWKGKEEIRKEISLIGMAHRSSYVLQSSFSHMTHMLEGYIDGLNSRRPALFNVYAACPPEHGIGDDTSDMQSKLAVESRAFPLYKYDPDAGMTLNECSSIEGNPAIEEDWPTYTLKYEDENGKEASIDIPQTFADFALTEGRFRKHFRMVPADKWNDDMVPMHEFIEMDEDDRDGSYPYIWGVDKKNRLTRIMCNQEMVLATEERREFWRQLKSLTRDDNIIDVEAVKSQAKAEMAQQLSSTLLSMAINGAGDVSTSAALSFGDMAAAPGAGANGGNGANGNGSFEAVWIETPECTACDECVDINPKVFKYNDDKQAIIVDPTAGSFQDIVKAAEKCTAECIHPGTPFNPNEKGLDKLMKRAEKFN